MHRATPTPTDESNAADALNALNFSNPQDRMLPWFQSDHLPENLQDVADAFETLAHRLVLNTKAGPERTVALRKLLEAKDAAVRATLNPGG